MTDAAYHLDAGMYACEEDALAPLIADARLDAAARAQISARACALVHQIRSAGRPGLMEVFLGEYGLSTDEGVALMCLAEALLRVPDAGTMDALIEDKIAPSDWQSHLGRSTSSLVNASTWALMLTGRVLEEAPPGPVGHLRAALKRLGEPVIRSAVTRAMKEMGRQFVLGETISSAMQEARARAASGYTFSYDMLGEAAMTAADAARYQDSYTQAIAAIAKGCAGQDVRANPGISVKLSALHPRYERAQAARCVPALSARLTDLARAAKAAGMGLNVDAEEAERLSLSLEVIEASLASPDLAGWDGFGVVVQAYSPRAGAVIDALYEMATRYDRRLMVRLVKGAYWDTEIKRAQVLGMPGFPVFTEKAATDVSYIANARRLFDRSDRLYPQFATHNAHTVAAVLHLAEGRPFEFQRLHGMGEVLHDAVMQAEGTRCRIYAPVGAHRDLLAYLVRRLLENGANSSFVHQIVDSTVSPKTIAADPFDALGERAAPISTGTMLYAPARANAKGYDLSHLPTLADIDADRDRFRTRQWQAAALCVAPPGPSDAQAVTNPADPADTVGTVQAACAADAARAFDAARPFAEAPQTRAAVLRRAADLFEEASGEIFGLLAREAGKTLPDATAELREAVDFLRYYADATSEAAPLGTFVCISPWNFPLAIFTGQIAAALAAGNAVIAKPAPQTPLIAHRAAEMLYAAGVPRASLQVLPGGAALGAALTSDARLDGVAFTGSTATARHIQRALAEHAKPGTPFIAETGGLNAMIVDSTALPEQAVGAIVESAFQSAGQRCSALRCLYVQDEIAADLIEMLKGAMEAHVIGTPWALETDVGPVIDAPAQARIAAHCQRAKAEGRLIHALKAPDAGHFIAPHLIRVDGIADLTEEVFGPVLHLATFAAEELEAVVDAINATGYGLTFGVQTRIDDRVQALSERITAGNIYVNRNQIGAIVGSQPFGGTGLSGTGPKAGGPDYVARFSKRRGPDDPPAATAPPEALILPGPTGELNRQTYRPRAPLLCAGPGLDRARRQAERVEALGGQAIIAPDATAQDVVSGRLTFGGLLWWGGAEEARAFAKALAARPGPILPLITSQPDHSDVMHAHHLCVDTTASGGNAALLSAAM